MTTERMAPAHPYISSLGTGIAWTPDTVIVYKQGQPVETAAHTTQSPWNFRHTLAFRDCFPQVTHWWFRSIWTGRVAISAPDPAFIQTDELWGWVTFDVLDQPRRSWIVVNTGSTLAVTVPYPPNEVQIANLPYRLALGRLILATFQGDVPTDTWFGITSLVPAGDLAALFPLTVAEGQRNLGGNWQLVVGGEETLRGPLRTELCRVLGLEEPEG